jgi:hypothetical protein
MTLNDSMLNVFCLVDDQLTALHLDQVRQRGFAPRLHDSHTGNRSRVGSLGFQGVRERR